MVNLLMRFSVKKNANCIATKIAKTFSDNRIFELQIGGVPFAAVSIAVARGSDTEVGIIYNPFIDELFQATKGHGTGLNLLWASFEIAKYSFRE